MLHQSEADVESALAARENTERYQKPMKSRYSNPEIPRTIAYIHSARSTLYNGIKFGQMIDSFSCNTCAKPIL